MLRGDRALVTRPTSRRDRVRHVPLGIGNPHLGAGYRLWATETYVDGVPDPRNEVHYDLIVDAGEQLVPADLNAPAKSQRRTARAQLVPAFEAVLVLLGDVRGL